MSKEEVEYYEEWLGPKESQEKEQDPLYDDPIFIAKSKRVSVGSENDLETQTIMHSPSNQ